MLKTLHETTQQVGHAELRPNKLRPSLEQLGLIVAAVCPLMGTLAPSGAFAESPPPALEPRTNINPGLLYWQAFGAMPKLEETDRAALDHFMQDLASWSGGTSIGWSVRTPTNAAVLVSRYEDSLRLLDKARLSQAPCDWGADPAEGPNMVIPNTRGLRELVKVALLSAALQVETGTPDNSMDTVESVVTLARNFATDGTLVAVMLQQGAEEQVIDYLGAELGRYPVSSLSRFRTTLAQLPQQIPVSRGVESERTFQRWMLRQTDRLSERFPGEEHKAYIESRGVLLDLFGAEGRKDEKMAADLDKASGKSLSGLRRLLNDLTSYYDDGRAIALAGPEKLSAEANALERRIETGANPLATAVVPNFGRARVREVAHMTRWAMMKAALTQRVDGEGALATVPDPFSAKPFGETVLEAGVIELRCPAITAGDAGPILRVLKSVETNR